MSNLVSTEENNHLRSHFATSSGGTDDGGKRKAETENRVLNRTDLS